MLQSSASLSRQNHSFYVGDLAHHEPGVIPVLLPKAVPIANLNYSFAFQANTGLNRPSRVAKTATGRCGAFLNSVKAVFCSRVMGGFGFTSSGTAATIFRYALNAAQSAKS